MTMGENPHIKRFVSRLLDDLKYHMDLKPRIRNEQFHNHDFLDGYAFGLRVAMDVVLGRNPDAVCAGCNKDLYVKLHHIYRKLGDTKDYCETCWRERKQNEV